MANKRLLVSTPLLGENIPSNQTRPQIADEYEYISWSDITGFSKNTLPSELDPNDYLVEFVCTDAVATAIESDPDYIVFSNDEIEEVI